MRGLRVLAAEDEGGGNFLVPNGTILFELLFFLLILFILGRFVVPPISRVMREREQMVQQGIEDAQQARDRAEEARQATRRELDEARAEAGKIRDRARTEADKQADAKRAQAQSEVAEVRAEGEARLREQREQASRELRAQVGGMALTLSGRILGDVTADDERLRATIDSFLADIDAADLDGADPDADGVGPATTSVPTGAGAEPA